MMCALISFVLILIGLNFRRYSGGVEGKFMPFIENEIELTHERHTYSEFRYQTTNTLIGNEWHELPIDTEATIREAKDFRDCLVPMKIYLENYKAQQRTICLYRDTKWARWLNSTVEVDGKTFTRTKFIDEIHPVKGFMVHEMNSLVKGYLIDGYFYGTLRIYDPYSSYHIHFYIEPLNNRQIEQYSKHKQNLTKRRTEDNALVFEYVGHDAEVGAIRPPEDVAAEQYEIQKNETGGSILTQFGGFTLPNVTISKTLHKPQKREGENSGSGSTTTPSSRHNVLTRVGEKRRKEAAAGLTEIVPDDITIAYHDDVAGIIPFVDGVSTSDIFDTSSEKSSLCTLCVWIEPLFADIYGFQKGRMFGVSEVIEMLRRMDWSFRAMDFNGDTVAENFGFILKEVIVSDEISVAEHRKNRRRRREDEDVTSTTSNPSSIHSHTSTKTSSPDVGQTEPGAHNVSHPSKQARPKKVYKTLLSQITKHPKFKNCCAIIAFVHLDLTPVLSVSTIRGLCSRNNLVVVSGILHGHKVGIYDLQRATFHAFGHMLGAEHEKTMKAKCQDRKPSKYYNPFIMHPVQQANVGLRPNSFRMSPCSKLQIVEFLDSNNLVHCLIKDTDDFCGNGMVDPGEECDCGSAWQCHLEECCGESDTIFRCRVTRLGRHVKCDRPRFW